MLDIRDIILSINGHQIESADAVARVVHDSEVGDVLNIEILRGDASLTVQVTVGSREHKDSGTIPPRALLRLIDSGLLQRAWSAEIVVGTGNGPKTISLLGGTVAAVDPEANSLTVSPRDGSDDVPYQLADDTLVIQRKHRMDLSHVNVGDTVRIISVDGGVKIVLAGHLRSGPRIVRGNPQRRTVQPRLGLGIRPLPNLRQQIPLNLDRICDSLPGGLPLLCERVDDGNSVEAPTFEIERNSTAWDTL